MTEKKRIRDAPLREPTGQDPGGTIDNAGLELMEPSEKSEALTPDERKMSLYDFTQNDDLFMKDLYLTTSGLDGWTYLIDTGNDKVYPFDDYRWSAWRDLQEKGKVTLTAMAAKDAKDYLKEFGD